MKQSARFGQGKKVYTNKQSLYINMSELDNSIYVYHRMSLLEQIIIYDLNVYFEGSLLHFQFGTREARGQACLYFQPENNVHMPVPMSSVQTQYPFYFSFLCYFFPFEFLWLGRGGEAD